MSKFTIENYGLSKFNSSRLLLGESPKKILHRNNFVPNPNIGPQRQRKSRINPKKTNSKSKQSSSPNSILEKLKNLTMKGGKNKSKKNNKSKK